MRSRNFLPPVTEQVPKGEMWSPFLPTTGALLPNAVEDVTKFSVIRVPSAVEVDQLEFFVSGQATALWRTRGALYIEPHGDYRYLKQVAGTTWSVIPTAANFSIVFDGPIPLWGERLWVGIHWEEDTGGPAVPQIPQMYAASDGAFEVAGEISAALGLRISGQPPTEVSFDELTADANPYPAILRVKSWPVGRPPNHPLVKPASDGNDYLVPSGVASIHGTFDTARQTTGTVAVFRRADRNLRIKKVQADVVLPEPGSTFAMGIYEHQEDPPYPTELIAGTAAVSSASGGVQEIDLHVGIAEGQGYWVSLHRVAGGTSPQFAAGPPDPLHAFSASDSTLKVRRSMVQVASTGLPPQSFPAGASFVDEYAFRLGIVIDPEW